MNARQTLIIVRGLDVRREHLAALLADALDGPTVHVRGDDLGRRWVVRGLGHPRRDIEGLYRLLRLVVVSYLKDGYSVVIDAPFVIEIAETVELRTRDLHDITRLAATFRTIATGVVTLQSDTDGAGHVALAGHHLDDEVRVTANDAPEDPRTIRSILLRLGL